MEPITTQPLSVHGSTSKRSYTRDELFRLAKSMKDAELSLDLLNELENFDWDEYKEWLEYKEVDDGVESYGARPGLSRQTSNLVSRKHGLGSDNSSMDARRYPEDLRMRLTRMTSSPTIKYNRMIQPGDSEGMPNQLKAKYAKLIESFSNVDRSNDRFEQLRTGEVAYLQRQQSIEHSNFQRPLVRPNKLFGPLRREYPRDDRRTSEEPMSLPYDLNNYIRSKSGWQPADQYEDLLDASPIRRINSTEKSTGDRSKRESSSGNPDDDEFDITNLLSITVLSDIKTIRQDLKSSGRHLSSLTSKQLPKNRHKESATVPRMPGRARSAMDSNYRRNIIADGEYQLSSQYSSLHHYADNRMDSGSISLNSDYSWAAQPQQQATYLANREVALRRTVAVPTKLETKDMGRQVDEKQAQIIEKFKAQVKARAKEVAAEEGQKKSQPLGESPKASSGEANDASAAPPKRRVAVIKPPGGSEPVNPRELDDGIKAELTPPISGGAQVEVPKKPLGSDVSSAAVKQETTTTTTNADINAGDDTSSGRPKVSSNIPMLISLHKSKFTSSSSSTTVKQTSVELTGGGRATMTPNAKVDMPRTPVSKATSFGASAPRFVSQYKRLRGKSLADEVDESK